MEQHAAGTDDGLLEVVKSLPLCDVGLFVSAHQAARQTWPEASNFGNMVRANWQEPLIWHIPLIGSGVLTLVGILSFARSPPDAMWRMGRRQHYFYLALSVWSLVIVYNVLVQVCETPLVRSNFGNLVPPIRFVMEPVAASPAIIALHFATRSVSAASVPPTVRRAWYESRNLQLYRTLLLQSCMMATAYLATYVRSSPKMFPAVVLVPATFVSFYANIATLVSWVRPLQ